MPIKSDSQLMYSLDGKVFHELSEIPTLASGGIINNQSEVFGSLGDSPELIGTFKIKPNKNCKRFIRQIQSIFHDSNNYRKRHGIPIRRKVR